MSSTEKWIKNVDYKFLKIYHQIFEVSLPLKCRKVGICLYKIIIKQHLVIENHQVSLNETQSVYKECCTVHIINTLLGKQRGKIKLP